MTPLAIFTIVKSDGSTITLSADPQAAPFVGYHLTNVTPRVGQLEVVRNGSPYVDGSRIVNQRSDNVVEQYTLDIVGSSPDDAMLKLAVLYQIVYWARDAQINPGVLTPQGITVTYPGMSRSGFAYILNGQVDETWQTPRVQTEGNRIKNIVLTLERTRWGYASGNAIAPTAYRTGAGGVWGVMAIDNVGLGSVKGDVPAKVELAFSYDGVTGLAPLNRVVCGYMSDQRSRGGYTGITVPSAPYLFEAESFSTKTNFGSFASATASPGGAGLTFVANTATTGSISTAVTLPAAQKYRVFVRMQNAAASTVAVTFSADNGFVTVCPLSPSVVPASGQWRMYEMGVISLPSAPGLNGNGTVTESIFLKLNAVATGAQQVYIDFVMLIPCGEYYLDFTEGTSLSGATVGGKLRYSNIVIPQAVGVYAGTFPSPTALFPLKWSGEMRFPPGKGTLFWLTGDANFGNTLGQNLILDVNVAYQFETPPTA